MKHLGGATTKVLASLAVLALGYGVLGVGAASAATSRHVAAQGGVTAGEPDRHCC